MSDPAPSPGQAPRLPRQTPPRSFFERLTALLHHEPEDRDELRAVLESAHTRNLLDADALAMIEGVMAVSELTAGEIMVPRSRMDILDVSKPLADLLPVVLETAHSRFPVYEGERDNVVGILLAKDLLRLIHEPQTGLKALLRPVVFIPESKRLDTLLRDFRSNRNHLAVVVDEHGGVAGLVTIEDVLEQIVGQIEDEHDDLIAEQPIVADGKHRWRVMATVRLDRFNAHFASSLGDADHDTLGGWLAGELGRIPRRGDLVEVNGLRLEVIRADARRALWLRVERSANPAL